MLNKGLRLGRRQTAENQQTALGPYGCRGLLGDDESEILRERIRQETYYQRCEFIVNRREGKLVLGARTYVDDTSETDTGTFQEEIRERTQKFDSKAQVFDKAKFNDISIAWVERGFNLSQNRFYL